MLYTYFRTYEISIYILFYQKKRSDFYDYSRMQKDYRINNLSNHNIINRARGKLQMKSWIISRASAHI